MRGTAPKENKWWITVSQHQLSKQGNGNVYLLTQSQVMSAGLVIYREETKHDSSL